MTPLDKHLAEIGWSARELAIRIGAHPNTINDWRLNRRRTPSIIMEWLQDLARYHVERPAPAWRARSQSSDKPQTQL